MTSEYIPNPAQKQISEYSPGVSTTMLYIVFTRICTAMKSYDFICRHRMIMHPVVNRIHKMHGWTYCFSYKNGFHWSEMVVSQCASQFFHQCNMERLHTVICRLSTFFGVWLVIFTYGMVLHSIPYGMISSFLLFYWLMRVPKVLFVSSVYILISTAPGDPLYQFCSEDGQHLQLS